MGIRKGSGGTSRDVILTNKENCEAHLLFTKVLELAQNIDPEHCEGCADMNTCEVIQAGMAFKIMVDKTLKK